MNIFEMIAEERILQAIADGHFENLGGNGRPQHSTEDAGIPEDTRLAKHILKNNGFTLTWIELQQEIQTSLALAKNSFYQSYLPGQDTISNKHALNHFREEITLINRKIMRYNLQVPLPGLQYYPLDLENEIRNCLYLMNQNSPLEGNT